MGNNSRLSKKIPSRYVGKSFFEASHEEIDNFKKLSNKEKWEMGYWIEEQAYRKAGKIGLISGIVIAVFIILITLNLIS